MYSAAQARPSHLAGAAYRASGAYQTIGSSLYGLRSYGGKIGKMQWCLLFSGAVASTVCSVDWTTSTRNMMNSNADHREPDPRRSIRHFLHDLFFIPLLDASLLQERVLRGSRRQQHSICVPSGVGQFTGGLRRPSVHHTRCRHPGQSGRSTRQRAASQSAGQTSGRSKADPEHRTKP
jgi:hypothetical protein